MNNKLEKGEEEGEVDISKYIGAAEPMVPHLKEVYIAYRPQIVGCIWNPPIGPGWSPEYPGNGPGSPMRPWPNNFPTLIPDDGLKILRDQLTLAKEKGKIMENSIDMKLRHVENGYILEINKKVFICATLDQVSEMVKSQVEEIEKKTKS